MKKLLIVAAVILVLFVGCGVLLTSGDDDTGTDATTTDGATDDTEGESDGDDPLSMSSNEEYPPAEDVTITSCEAGEFGADITLDITNNSPKASTYSIDIQLQDEEGNVVGEAISSVSGLRPGQTAKEEAASFDSPEGGFTCHLNSVDRFSAEG